MSIRAGGGHDRIRASIASSMPAAAVAPWYCSRPRPLGVHVGDHQLVHARRPGEDAHASCRCARRPARRSSSPRVLGQFGVHGGLADAAAAAGSSQVLSCSTISQPPYAATCPRGRRSPRQVHDPVTQLGEQPLTDRRGEVLDLAGAQAREDRAVDVLRWTCRTRSPWVRIASWSAPPTVLGGRCPGTGPPAAGPSGRRAGRLRPGSPHGSRRADGTQADGRWPPSRPRGRPGAPPVAASPAR